MSATAGPVERLPPDPSDPLWGDHISRYRFALPAARGARVLDAGCGTGFGAGFLARGGARCVTALDVSVEAVTATLRDHGTSGVRVVQADVCALPFAKASFDFITCFETLEHVADADSLVAELRRVLTLAGRLFVSTPNGELTGGAHRRPANPFHVREFDASGLRAVLGRRFAEVRLFGQHLSRHYAIAPQFVGRGFERRPQSPRVLLWRATRRLPHPLRDALARAWSGRPFYPAPDAFTFTEGDFTEAHVLVAVCG